MQIVAKIGSLFASDGFIKKVKYSDLEGIGFAEYYYYYYGQIDKFQIKFKDRSSPEEIEALSIAEAIKKNIRRDKEEKLEEKNKEVLEFEILNETVAYLGIHSFANDIIRKSQHKRLKPFLESSFQVISDRDIKTLIVDVSQNGGGNEGNEDLLYSYIGPNYRKYKKVRAKTQKVTLDNGYDPPIQLKTFGLLERLFANQKMADGSYERKITAGHGLMAFDEVPEHKFEGKVYVIISPVTYSGGSEFANMMYTNDLAIFVGEETGGGYLGNTSGYSRELILPNSKIEIDIPVLQFVMNVKTTDAPFGSGVRPHHQVIATFDQYSRNENAALQYILEQLESDYMEENAITENPTKK